MADIDTKVLYLETPSVSAPPAAYTIGVRMRNVGIHARSTAGYVQVFLKSTGMLEKTYIMTSAVIDPDEEKQAYSAETWDLREVAPGTQYILSGMITCDGDMVHSNDILNPTTVTVVDAPPPPPPPVAAHASQHADGGSDELSVEGLHGLLGDPQPYAAHASKHQDGGADELNLGSMSGQLKDAQIPSDHGNERHIEDFALSSELSNHFSDATPHNDALGSPWIIEAGTAPGPGPSSALAPAEHRHGGEGGLDMATAGPLSGAGNHDIKTWTIEDGCLLTGLPPTYPWERYLVHLDVAATVSELPGPGSTVSFVVRSGTVGGAAVTRSTILVPVDPGTMLGQIHVHFSFYCWTGATDGVAHAIFNTAVASCVHLVPASPTGALSRSGDQEWLLRLNIAGTTTIDEIRAYANLQLASAVGP